MKKGSNARREAFKKQDILLPLIISHLHHDPHSLAPHSTLTLEGATGESLVSEGACPSQRVV
jgi:hypothetical protein